MKFKTCRFGLVTLSVILSLGCRPTSEKAPESVVKTTWHQIIRTEEAVLDFRQEFDAYTYTQKTQLITSLEKKLTAINRSIDELVIHAEHSEAELKTDTTFHINRLRTQANLLETFIDAAKTPSLPLGIRSKPSSAELRMI